MPRDGADEDLDRVVVVARCAAAQQGERAGIVEQTEQVHGSGLLVRVSWETTGTRERARRETPKAAPRAAFAKFWERAVSGPPGERSTTSSDSGPNARACPDPSASAAPAAGGAGQPRLTW
ncbi:hypothetical protein GCM10009535_29300 [Streptomyces thermocarboxydovorans]|uniref:Uncharacterized protein n=1 Tax=Streptomyces thermocarboxydovorans TaxID=59298 RepID=A0ABN1HHG4_9ACTN